MENESKKSLAEMYMDQLERIACVEAERDMAIHMRDLEERNKIDFILQLEGMEQLKAENAALQAQVRSMSAEIRILRYVINPHTLESLIRDGRVPVGDGVLPWATKWSPLGLDGLLASAQAGKVELAPGVGKAIADRLASLLAEE
jgi:hypothetical protein